MPFIPYHIDGDPSIFDRIQELAEGRSVFCLTDEELLQHAHPILERTLSDLELKTISIPTGEAEKTIATCETIWKELLHAGAERDSLLIALGGGVVTDIGGFVASTYRRGMPCVLVPTSLLAMVDAAIGGKNGVDFMGYKNMIGTFHQVEDVLIHPPFLQTLGQRQIRAGFAEVLKHALLDGGTLWERVRSLEPDDKRGIEAIVADAVEVKRRIVEMDPEEKGVRESLNFGHTVGHAMESLYMNGQDPLLHGEAVAFGMLVEAKLSHELKGFPARTLDELKRVVKAHFGSMEIPDPDELLKAMRKDKKRKDGALRVVLLEALGDPRPAQELDEEVMLRTLRSFDGKI